MEVGDSQLLYPTVLPVDSTNPGFVYNSKNDKIATVNGLGRITAVSEGTTEITIKADKVVKVIQLTVSNKEDIRISEIDLGDFPDSMKVGESMLLNLSVLPYEASSRIITYESLNQEIVTINAFGRLEAHSVGTVQIVITGDEITHTMDLVIEESDDYPVTAIEFGEYENEMEKGKSQQLVVNILPEKASSTNTLYSSSQNKVATVSSTGEIKAVEVGNAIITIEAGNIMKQISINVVTATSKIDVNETYLVLKENEEFQLISKVLPEKATQKLEYKSMNTDVVTVSGDGLLTAKELGEATIVVSNEYMQQAVTVIVNKNMMNDSTELVEEIMPSMDSNPLLNLLKLSPDITEVDNELITLISKSELKYLYESKKTLAIESKEYNLSLSGSDIVNFENELSTQLLLTRENSNIRLVVNEGENLPGKISITLNDKESKNLNYLYLFNTSKDKFELLNGSLNQGNIEVDLPGEYLLTEKKLTTLNINILFVLVFVLALLVVGGVYVFVKKKHWFW